jgi:hypothetical protein
MNNHKTACMLLLFLVVGMLYGVNSLRNATSKAREVSQQSQSEAEAAEQSAQLAEIQLKSLDSKTAQLRLLYGEWKPHFDSHQNPQDAERKIADVIREGDFFLLSQKFTTAELEKESIISEALVADLIVEDDYAKTLNWLGRLEESIPSCRITKCQILRGDRGNDVHLELQVQIPIVSI